MGPRAVALVTIGLCFTASLHAQPQAPNPALSLIPKGVPVDWAYWNRTMTAASRAWDAAEHGFLKAIPEHIEREPPEECAWNSAQTAAEHLTQFGRLLSERIVVKGVLCDSLAADLGELPEGPDEDDGSIPLAREVVLAPGDRVRLRASIGDGPHGSEGSGNGDYDVYHVGFVEAGQLITAQIETAPESDPRLDTKVALYDAEGRMLDYNDDGREGSPDSFLQIRPPASGHYWVLIRGINSAWPADPFDSSSGPKAGSEGTYTLTLGREGEDIDFYSFDLEAGDVLSASATGDAYRIALHDDSETLRIATGAAWGAVYAEDSPLLKGGDLNVASVAIAPGRYAVAVTRGAGEYELNLGVYRSTPAAKQVLFLDFDGASVDATGWSGHADAQLSSLGSILNAHQLGAVESDVVDVALAAVHENLKEDLQNAHGTGFQLDILNSRDHADPWGDPNVSRVIIGGTREEAGVDAVGFAESVDVGNFNLAETAIVLLDILVSAWHDLSPRRVPVAAGYSESEVIGRAIGTVASHEAGHLFATFHTGQPGLEADLMRAGWDPYLLMGMGPDGVLGTADDQDVDFVESRYYSRGPFTGLQDAPSAIRHGLAGPAHTAREPAPRSGGGIVLGAVWPNPANVDLHVSIGAMQRNSLSLELWDLLGRRVRVQPYVAQGGTSHVVLPVYDLASGVYLLRAIGPEGTDTRRVVIAH